MRGRSRALACGAILCLAGTAAGAIRWANGSGNAYHRTDFANIQFKLNAATAQSLTPDGDPAAAIQSALNSWNGLQYTSVHFAPLGQTSSGISGSDGVNVIAVADSPAAISAVGSFLAVTLTSSQTDGTILDTDIILNPTTKFSVTSQPNTYDLQSVITHELGHSLGANHSAVFSATMFYNTRPQETSQTLLQPDEASFAADAYPAPNRDQGYGVISGTATKDGAPLPGAVVLATDPGTGVTIGGISSAASGVFSVRVPIGNYLVFATPLTGIMPVNELYNVPGAASTSTFSIPASAVDTAFKAAPAGNADLSSTFRVDPGATVAANVATAGGSSAIAIAGLGQIVTVNGTSSYAIGPQPVSAPAGQPLDFIVSGPGLDSSITQDDIRIIGPGAQIRPGTLTVETRIQDLNGRNPLRFTIDVSAGSGHALSLFIVHGSDRALASGAILVLGSKPVFTANGLVDAASFKGAGVAPGELVSLFGTNVGPVSAVSNSGFDPATGALSGTLAGVSVTFDGIGAPLVFAASGQINAQVPYEVAGHGSTVVVVRNQGTSSDPVTVPVIAAQPGLFASANSQAVALNQDGTVNSPSNPAAKGSVVTLYATGQGLTNPPVPTGMPAPASPLSYATSPVVTIGGADAQVYFAGLAPGFVGLLQVNAGIPQASPTGAATVQLSVNGATSQAPVTIAVR